VEHHGPQLPGDQVQTVTDFVEVAPGVRVLGSIAMELAGRDRPGALPPGTDRVAARTTPSDAADDQRPRTAAASATRARYVSTEQYLWGLHRILDAIATVAGNSDVAGSDVDGSDAAASRTLNPAPRR